MSSRQRRQVWLREKHARLKDEWSCVVDAVTGEQEIKRSSLTDMEG